MREVRSQVVRLLVAASILWAVPAWADPPTKSPTVDVEEQAHQCFQRGLELFQEGDLDGATVEFRRAYDLAANFRILFNLGQVAADRHDYAVALDWFARYLKEGAGRIPGQRRHGVEEEMAKLRQRVGRLDVVAPTVEAEILVDDEVVGRSPLAVPLTVNVGRRRVATRTKEGVSEPKFVDVPSGELVVVEFKQSPAARVKRSFAALSATPSRGKGETDLALTSSPRARASEGMGRGVWMAWTATGVCAAGAVASGLLAYRWEQQLRDQRASYPVTSDELANQQHKVRAAGLVTDGFLVGTAIGGAISITLTIRGARGRSVSIFPGGMALRQAF